MPDRISEQIDALQCLERPALMARWTDVFGRPAPKQISRDLLMRALAYHLQERAEDGLTKAALKQLAVLANRKGVGDLSPKPKASRLRSGTRLVREWRGAVHQVTVCEKGFTYRGAEYTSLSQIAREITGTRWSGPLFFGLRKASKRAEASTDAG